MTVRRHDTPHLFTGKLFFLAAAVFLWLCAGCVMLSPTEEQGGSGSEIVGNAEYGDSTVQCALAKSGAAPVARLPLALGNVFCYTRSFIPDTAWAARGASPRAYTDSLGRFHLLDVPRGDVVVEANNGSGMGIVKTITIDRDSSLFDIGTLTVAQTGGISIQAHTQLPGRVRFYVSVKGTRSIVRGTQTGMAIVLANIPVGMAHTVNIRVYEPVPMELNIPDIVIPPGGIRLLDAFEIKE